ncbi:MAG: ribonuclease HI family protein [Firmicutes bacterium]|nr:ribonuclease HI family protein [Bacillota bacterium]
MGEPSGGGRSLILHTDGAARGNPGPAGIGVLILDEHGRTLERIAEPIGETTNNVAEYRALLRGLRRARELGAERVRVFSDSELMVRQLSGAYRVKQEHLRALHEEALRLARAFAAFDIVHVPRERNREADRLANEGIDRTARA